MGMNVSEKILAKASGKKRVSPGEFVWATPDKAYMMDRMTPTYYNFLKEVGLRRVYDSNQIIVSFDHHVPADSLAAAERQRICREFVREQGIKHFYDIGRAGINHQFMAEIGHARPGTLIVGDDTHAPALGGVGAFAVGLGMDIGYVLALGKAWFRVPESFKISITGKLPVGVMSRDLIQWIIGEHNLGSRGAVYKALEFAGPTVDKMSIDGRLTLCCLSVQSGAKTGIVNPDRKTMDYVKARAREPFEALKSDLDAEYEEVLNYDVSGLEPQVAFPPAPNNVKTVTEAEGIEIDQAVVCSCAGARIEDLRAGAEILRGRKVHPGVRMIVIPVTQEVYLDALEEGLIKVFIQSGAVVCAPTCGACSGALAQVVAGETTIQSSVLNSPGRCGSPEARIYLASAATIAASAVNGKITDPRKFLE
jgi:3-isopropylmalate/(R)-2-methylmalate dehydratase large subunit